MTPRNFQLNPTQSPINLHLKHLLPLVGVMLAACQTSPNRFDQADLDGDGKLSRDEVHGYLVTSVFASRDANKDKLMTKAEWGEDEAETNKIFAARDTNKDGMVSLEEAKAHARKVGAFDDVIKEADANKDGFISREEATAYYASKEGAVR